jgi:hypothetical protein
LFIVLPLLIHVPWEIFFQGDAAEYSGAALHILRGGFYSLDGIHPLVFREPGMSAFLAAIYFVFGAQNGLAVVGVQALLYWLSAWFFCTQLARSQNARVAGICFVLLCTSGSVFHSVISAYRECMALSMLMTFCGLLLWNGRELRWWRTAVMGALLGGLILLYYTFIFLPPLLLLTLWKNKPLLRHGAVLVVAGYLIVGAWGLRNASYDGQFRVINSQRTAVMWYVRGEQAERVTGFEPFRCLWSEYISRNWTGRSDACSFNGLMHRRWPQGVDDTANAAVAKAGQAKILAYLPSYLNFSFYEVLELHLPYVGGGWSTAFNVFAALTALVLYVGFVVGLTAFFRRENILWMTIIAYNTLVFVLTDATPRYLVPVLFCYAVFSAIGYDRLLQRFFRASA